MEIYNLSILGNWHFLRCAVQTNKLNFHNCSDFSTNHSQLSSISNTAQHVQVLQHSATWTWQMIILGIHGTTNMSKESNVSCPHILQKFCNQMRDITKCINFAFSKCKAMLLQTQQLSILTCNIPMSVLHHFQPVMTCVISAQWWGDELNFCTDIQYASLSHAVQHQHSHHYRISQVDAFLYTSVKEVQQQLPWNHRIAFEDHQLPLNSNLPVSLLINHIHGWSPSHGKICGSAQPLSAFLHIVDNLSTVSCSPQT